MSAQKVLRVSFYGLPNVGKSSILNALSQEKVSAVSKKAHTTKESVSGIVTKDNAQIVFVDVPGLVKKGAKGVAREVLKGAKAEIFGSDLVCFVIDGTRNLDAKIMTAIQESRVGKERLIVAINKMDMVKDHSRVLDFAKNIIDTEGASEIFFLSAKTKRGINDLKEYLFTSAKDGFWMYEESEKTNKTKDFALSEITREKFFKNLHHEVPHDIKVITERIVEEEDKFTVNQTIYAQKEGQKAIILGKGGSVIKRIAGFAVRDMETLLKKKVALFLFVKVRDLTDKPSLH